MPPILAIPCIVAGLRGIGLQYLALYRLIKFIWKHKRFPNEAERKDLNVPWSAKAIEERMKLVVISCGPLLIANWLSKFPELRTALEKVGLKFNDDGTILENNITGTSTTQEEDTQNSSPYNINPNNQTNSGTQGQQAQTLAMLAGLYFLTK